MPAPSSDQAGIRQTIRALKAAGYALSAVDDGDYYDQNEGGDKDGDLKVATETEAIEAITAVDDAKLYAAKGGCFGWVRFVMGNDPEEVVCDYTMSLGDVLDPLTEKWQED